MKSQYQIESCRGVWNLPGMGWNWLTRDTLFEDRSFFYNVHPWRVCSIPLTTFMVVIVVCILEDEPAFGHVLTVCAVCVYVSVNAVHTRESQRRMAVSLTQSHSDPPARQAGLQAPESHLSQTTCWGYKRFNFLHGGGMWTQDDVLSTEPFILDG